MITIILSALLLVVFVISTVERVMITKQHAIEIEKLNTSFNQERASLLDRIQADSFIEFKQMEIAQQQVEIKEEGPKYEYQEV